MNKLQNNKPIMALFILKWHKTHVYNHNADKIILENCRKSKTSIDMQK